MNGIALVLGALHQGENHLADQLTTVAGRHHAEHEVHHVAADLGDWSRKHVRLLAEAAHHHGLDFADTSKAPEADTLSMFRAKPGDAVADAPESGLPLLRDLSELHLSATENSLNWEMLAQVAQATKDETLLAVVSECHPQTLRQLRWTNTMIKTLAPQVLTTL
ncbi:hypothetical protein PV726_44920 [Streptomyces europaeiscabiei]|uniref:hypothetical protein n=1 Tax=Streptomyces europaeiscabiei TaxID=146819 RepID=UPI0029A92304|nr:hypothetical protein [Streptomyces europaeiscabiei]MDX3697234.1 hypothetical protein [Streptomyces europaeiscabiei]